MQPPIHVTIHAIRRYAERGLGFVVPGDDRDAMIELEKRGVDLQSIRDTLAALGAKARCYGAPAIIIGRIKVIRVGDDVVTVAPKSGVY